MRNRIGAPSAPFVRMNALRYLLGRLLPRTRLESAILDYTVKMLPEGNSAFLAAQINAASIHRSAAGQITWFHYRKPLPLLVETPERIVLSVRQIVTGFSLTVVVRLAGGRLSALEFNRPPWGYSEELEIHPLVDSRTETSCIERD